MRTARASSIRKTNLLAAVALLSCTAAAHADFTYTETTQLTGGSTLGMMKMAGAFSRQARQASAPIASTVSIKGNRMARINPDTTEIVDLDAETITTIDTVRHKYTVITFDQMRRQAEAAVQKANAQQASPQQEAPATAQQPSDVDMKFRVDVRSTGAAKEVAGLTSAESILTMAMDGTDKSSGQTASFAITNDMWLAPEIPGYGEVREFYKRYAAKMGSVFSGSVSPAVLAQYRGAGEGMSQMVKEMSKLKGTPVLQVMRMGMTTDGKPLPAASEAPLPASPPPLSASDIAKQSAASALASSFGGLGGLGGFGRKRKADPPPEDAAASATPAPTTAAVLMESTTQLTSFSQTAAESSFLIPAGFEKVDFKAAN